MDLYKRFKRTYFSDDQIVRAFSNINCNRYNRTDIDHIYDLFVLANQYNKFIYKTFEQYFLYSDEDIVIPKAVSDEEYIAEVILFRIATSSSIEICKEAISIIDKMIENISRERFKDYRESSLRLKNMIKEMGL